MAYAAVTCLVKKLECFVRFPCMVLVIKIMQVEAFVEKVYELLNLLEGTPILAGSRVEKLRKEIEPLGLLIGDFIEANMSDGVIMSAIREAIRLTFVFYRGKPLMFAKMVLGEVPNILDQINSIVQKLNEFHYKMDVPESRGNLRLLYFLDMTRDMVRAGDKLKKAVMFFRQMATDIAYLCDNQQVLLSFLEDSSNVRQCQEVEKGIQNVAERAGVFVKGCMMDRPIESEMKYLEHVIMNVTKECAVRKIRLETEFKNVEREKGIHLYLLQASGEICFIQRKIRKICDKKPSANMNSEAGHSPLKSKGSLIQDLNLENNVVGLEDDVMRMIDALAGPKSGLEIQAIVGMGGIGKTTLARKVFNHPRITHHFRCRAWVSVSQVYQIRGLLVGLLEFFNQPCDIIREKSNQELGEHLYRSLKGRKYLIVMDDIWSSEAWDAVQMYFPDDNNGSRVLLTSRLTELATYISPKNAPHCMTLLDTEQSWELLEKHVFGLGSCPLELVEFGKQMAKKCRGLPLAIVVIAGILSQRRTPDCWKDIADSVSSIVSTNPEQFFDILALSYNSLPPHLQPCFLYMGAFPEG